MKTITFLLLIMTLSMNAQVDKPNFVCHNNNVVMTLNDQAFQGHLNHGDFVVEDADESNVGDECGTLGLPKFNIKKDYPVGINYHLFDISGKSLKTGNTYKDMYDDLPIRTVLILRVEGYQPLKIIK